MKEKETTFCQINSNPNSPWSFDNKLDTVQSFQRPTASSWRQKSWTGRNSSQEVKPPKKTLALTIVENRSLVKKENS